MAFNEQRSYNIHELDAASNNSVDDIRQLIEQVRIPPQIGKYKVYIIDEVHMLSQSAFNAFLKTLEEPPHHAIFILATTEKHKILPTILSRCQIYDFNRIGVNDTVEHLQYVAQKEGIQAEPEALTVIAQKADGGMRDALSIFDQVASFTGGKITYQGVIENLNVLDYEYYFKLTDCFLENKVSEAMLLLNEILRKGFDGSHFITGLASHFRDLLVSKDASTLPLLEVGAGIRQHYQEQAKKCDQKFLYRAMKLVNDCDLNYRASKNKRLLVELTLIQCAQLTLPDADDIVGGRSPKRILKPLFKQQAAQQPAAMQPQSQTGAAAAQASTEGNNAGVHTSPLAGLRTDIKKKPVMRPEMMNVSIRGTRMKWKETEASQPAPQPSAPAPEEKYENRPFKDSELNFYWRDFAMNHLPKEEKANSARMMNITPKPLNDTVYEILVDNEMVGKYMNKLLPDVLKYIREQLHNRQVVLSVRVSEAHEVVRAYNQAERFQLMSKRNPKLLKLAQKFNLTLD
jgi:DNA polymerase-3 subunit gamma/tau